MDFMKEYEKWLASDALSAEEKADHFEDILGTYLVKLSRNQISDSDSAEVSKLLKAIGDFERISDHSINVLESAEEMQSKGIVFTAAAQKEMDVLCGAVSEILTLSNKAFVGADLNSARDVEPLEQVIDDLKLRLRNGHISRLRGGECTIEAGFVWADLITDMERVADHCSNIAVCVIDATEYNMNMHQSVQAMKKNSAAFDARVSAYAQKYSV